MRKIALFVPFQAFVLALLLMPVEYPLWLQDLLKRLGMTLVPLALVSVGYQMQLSAVRGKTLPLSLGLTFKLVAAPALIYAIYAGLLGASGEALKVTVFEAAMGPMIGRASSPWSTISIRPFLHSWWGLEFPSLSSRFLLGGMFSADADLLTNACCSIAAPG